jgi:hypothetical protein
LLEAFEQALAGCLANLNQRSAVVEVKEHRVRLLDSPGPHFLAEVSGKLKQGLVLVPNELHYQPFHDGTKL